MSKIEIEDSNNILFICRNNSNKILSSITKMFLQHLYVRGGKVREDKSKIKWSNHILFER